MTSTLLHPLALRPIIPAWLVVILALGLLGLAAWFLIKRPRERLDWTVRALMGVAVAGILLRPGLGESGPGVGVTDRDGRRTDGVGTRGAGRGSLGGGRCKK